MKYGGIDLHSNISMVTITDDGDRVVVEKRLPNESEGLLGYRIWSEKPSPNIKAE